MLNMSARYRFPAFLLGAAMLAITCSRPVDPWEETRLSRDTRQWLSPGGVWRPADLGLGEMKEHFGWFSSPPNLYDLHHPDGALALSTRTDSPLSFKILEAADLPVRADEHGDGWYYDGEHRRLSLSVDKTAVELPVSRYREALPHRIGILSLTALGAIRASDGERWSAPIMPDDVPAFAADWAAMIGANPPEDGGEVEAGFRVEILDDEIRLDGESVAPDTLARAVSAIWTARPGIALRLEPPPEVTYGRVVRVLDQIFQAASQGTAEARLGLPGRPARSLRLEESSTILVLKGDKDAPFASVDAVLKAIAPAVDRVALLTHLDLSDRDAVTAETYPGGLPGGLVLPIAAPSTGGSAGDVVPPEKISAPDPVYTEMARKARVEGVVILRGLVDVDGTIQDIEVLKGLPMGLTEQAIEAARRWRFRPATSNGETVRFEYNLAVTFRLESQ